MPDRVCQVHGHLVWVKLNEAVTRIARGVFLALLESVNVCWGCMSRIGRPDATFPTIFVAGSGCDNVPLLAFFLQPVYLACPSHETRSSVEKFISVRGRSEKSFRFTLVHLQGHPPSLSVTGARSSYLVCDAMARLTIFFFVGIAQRCPPEMPTKF